MKEKSLSSKIVFGRGEWGTKKIIRVEDVKGAVLRLKKKVKGYRTATYNMKFLQELDRFIDEIFGEELTQSIDELTKIEHEAIIGDEEEKV